MKFQRITIEQALFFLIFIIALGVRIMRIGEAPLSDFEAERAMQAYQVSRGESVDFSSGPAYSLLTGATFFLFADNVSYARIWSVLAGCCLVLFPYLIRSLIGRKAALIMALGLALDPSLVAFSRIAGNEMLAVGFGVMSLGLVYYRKPILAGIFGGLMLLSGPPALQGLLGFAFAWLIGILLSRRGFLDPFPQEESIEKDPVAIWSGILASGVVILVVGTLFFLIPTGLGSLTGSLPAYFDGWMTPSGIPASRLLATLVIYNPIALIFGMLGIVQGWRRRESLSQWLSIWVGTTFALTLLYPGRQVSDVVWVFVPLWTIAAIEIAKFFFVKDAERLPALSQALLIVLLMALGWLNLAGLSLTGGDIQTYRLRWAVIGGTLVLGAVTTLLIGLGWSSKTAKQGLAWGLLLGLGLYGVATMWGLSQLRPNGEQELLARTPVIKNAADLRVTLGDLSEWRTGFRDSVDIVVTNSAPSLQWELRNWSEARFLNSIPNGELPSIIINSVDQPSPSLSIGYRGQDFAWWSAPAWEGALPENWSIWLVYRDAPQNVSHIILWARGDLFPGGVITSAKESAPIEEDIIPFEELPVR